MGHLVIVDIPTLITTFALLLLVNDKNVFVCLDVFVPIDRSEDLNVSAPKSKGSFPLFFRKNGQDGKIHGENKTINTVPTK